MKEKLKAWMEENHISGYQMARDMGFSESLVSYVLTGKRSISNEFKVRFIEVYGLESYLKVADDDDQLATVLEEFINE